MPLYEYQCEACGDRFERIVKFSDPPIETCPKCGGAVRKLMSSPAIQFKGSGFYITDYAKKEHTDAAKADTDPAGGKDAKSVKEGKESKETKDTKSEKTPTSETASSSENTKPTTSSSATNSSPSTGKD